MRFRCWRVIWPFELYDDNNSGSSCFIAVRLTRCAVWIHWASLWRPSSSQVIHQGNARPAALSSSLIDARTQRISPSVLCDVVVDVDVLWADGNKSGDSTSSTVPSDGDDGVHPSGKDDSSSWTTATVQATSSADASPVVAGSVDSFSLTSTTSEMAAASSSSSSESQQSSSSETMLPIDSFLTPASSICSQQDYEILKASLLLLLLLLSRQRYIDWTGGRTACWLSPFFPGNCQLPFHHHLFPRLVSFVIVGFFFF